LLEHWLEHFLRASDIISGYRTQGEDFYMLAVWTLALNTAIPIYESLLKGYYAQSLTLIRVLQEQYVRFAYCILHPEQIPRLRAGKGPETSDMLSTLKSELQAKQLGKAYGVLSDFAHGNIPALRDIIISEGDPTTLHVGGWYVDKLFMGAASWTLGILGLLQLEFGNRFSQRLSGDPKWERELFELLEETQRIK